MNLWKTLLISASLVASLSARLQAQGANPALKAEFARIEKMEPAPGDMVQVDLSKFPHTSALFHRLAAEAGVDDPDLLVTAPDSFKPSIVTGIDSSGFGIFIATKDFFSTHANHIEGVLAHEIAHIEFRKLSPEESLHGDKRKEEWHCDSVAVARNHGQELLLFLQMEEHFDKQANAINLNAALQQVPGGNFEQDRYVLDLTQTDWDNPDSVQALISRSPDFTHSTIEAIAHLHTEYATTPNNTQPIPVDAIFRLMHEIESLRDDRPMAEGGTRHGSPALRGERVWQHMNRRTAPTTRSPGSPR